MRTEQQPQARLGRVRAVASGLLAAAAATFIGSLLIRNPGPLVMLLRSVAEAALAGGLADWFAVTALFRRPLGLPIPHTAIVPANKDRIGDGLARFLDRHFLTREVLVPELRSLHLAQRIAAWLRDRRKARAVAGEIAKALPALLRALDDREVMGFLARSLGTQLSGAPIGLLTGQLIELLMAGGYHHRVLDTAINHARAFLVENDERLLEGVAQRRRRWLPRTINREIARVMLRAAGELLDDLSNPEGAARQVLLTSIDEFARTLATSPALSAAPKGLLKASAIQAWIADAWQRARQALLRDLAAPSSRVRRVLALAISSVGEALADNAEIRDRLEKAIETVVVEALPWRAELIRFVTEVVRQWEPRSFSDRIEAAVGADLQYIRINGTIVGGLVGGALYAISLLAR